MTTSVPSDIEQTFEEAYERGLKEEVWMVHAAHIARDRMARDRRALRRIVNAWESLPEGNYSPSVIAKWLGKMAPAINNARKVLSK